jgi:hypothetical protein
MTIITTTVLPPPIAQYFSVDLLKKPTQKFNQDSSELKAMFEFVIKKYGHKADYHPARLERLKKLQQEFMELYERSAKKEEELKAKTKNAVPGYFYFVRLDDKRDAKILFRLRKWASRTRIYPS